MGETGGEWGGWRNKIKNLLRRDPENPELTPKEKAQQAFLNLSVTSKEMGLVSSLQFMPPVPPNVAFDLKDLNDLTIFRVEHDLMNPKTGEKLGQYNSDAAGDESIDQGSRYLYVCITKGQNGNSDTLYVPTWANGDDKHFYMHPNFTDVVSYPLNATYESELSWDEPLKTLPHEMFLRRTLFIDEEGNKRPFRPEEATVVFKQVDVVSGGTPEKQKSPQTATNPNRGVYPRLAPKAG